MSAVCDAVGLCQFDKAFVFMNIDAIGARDDPDGDRNRRPEVRAGKALIFVIVDHEGVKAGKPAFGPNRWPAVLDQQFGDERSEVFGGPPIFGDPPNSLDVSSTLQRVQVPAGQALEPDQVQEPGQEP